MLLAEALAITGSLSKPSKMPGYSYGLPAGRALWVDKSNPIIKAAGCNVGGKLWGMKDTTCSKCYALKGNYVFKHVKQAQQKRLEGVYNPLWVEAMVDVLYMTVDPNEPYFRWHDSGDILGLWHLVNIVEVCRKTKAIKHWLPTREVQVVHEYIKLYGEFPANLTVRISATKIDGKPNTFYKNTSTVHDKLEVIGKKCPAPIQDNKCGECRACWDKRVTNVSYCKH